MDDVLNEDELEEGLDEEEPGILSEDSEEEGLGLESEEDE